MKYGEIYLTKTWKKYPISTRVGKPNVADEPFNEQKKTKTKKLFFTHESAYGCVNVYLKPVTYCEATHVCCIDAREVTHEILMLLEEQG